MTESIAEPKAPCATPRSGLTLWRGSPRAAARTYWNPIANKEGPVWAHFALMLIGNTVISIIMTVVSLPGSFAAAWEIFGKVFPFAQFIGCSIIGLHTLGQSLIGEERIRSLPLPLHLLYRAIVAVLGVFVGYTIGIDWRTGTFRLGFDAFTDDAFVASIGIALLASFVFYQIVASQTRTARVQAEVERERARSAGAEAREAAARLQLLQAQIEPHFLFNTLANVLGLVDSRPQDAKVMLADFIYYLRGSLDVTRGAHTQLGSELELLRRYLSIFQFRMGKRLAFSIECPEELRGIPIAPMLLQPVVENCIEHGLEPKIGGGSITIQVGRVGSELRILIADTGLGFHPGAHSGIGLANVRERLALLYGEGAHLQIEEGQPIGTIARLSIALDATGTRLRDLAAPEALVPTLAGPQAAPRSAPEPSVDDVPAHSQAKA